MTTSQPDKLERIEALVERNAEAIQSKQQSITEMQQANQQVFAEMRQSMRLNKAKQEE